MILSGYVRILLNSCYATIAGWGGPPKMPLRSHGADSFLQFLSKWSEAGAASLGFLESPSCAWLSGLSSAPTAVGP